MTSTNNKKRESGSVMPMLCVSLGLILGMTALSVDLGVLNVRKQAHLNVVDSAALAGAEGLPDIEIAAERAVRMAELNRLKGSISVSFPSEEEIVVTTDPEPVPLFFGKVLGEFGSVKTPAVKARSSAKIYLPNAAENSLRPWGVDIQFMDDLEYGETVTLDLTGPKHSHNPDHNYAHHLNLNRINGKQVGSRNYEGQIVHGADTLIRAGDWAEIHPGNMVGHVKKGVADIMERASESPWDTQTWQTATPSNPRITIIAIIDSFHLRNGSNNSLGDAPILGFAAAYLEGVDNNSLHLRFLEYRKFAAPTLDYIPGYDPAIYDGKVRVVRLKG